MVYRYFMLLRLKLHWFNLLYNDSTADRTDEVLASKGKSLRTNCTRFEHIHVVHVVQLLSSADDSHTHRASILFTALWQHCIELCSN